MCNGPLHQRVCGSNTNSSQDLERELSAIVGLSQVKETLRDVHAQVWMRRERQQIGLPSSETTTLHMIFTGNPGTGKTMVARLVGTLFHRLGVLSSGHFIEVDPSGLIAGYVGQSALKMQEVIHRALGGVLFIDEAYGLYDSSSPSASSFGKEVIDTLVKAMEDHRNNLCVILAGYAQPMTHMLQVNPGMKSRIGFQMNFQDYSPFELSVIFQKTCAKEGSQLLPEGLHYVQGLFQRERTRLGEWGNGRFVWNVLDQAVRKQARRLTHIPHPCAQDLLTLTESDLRAWEERPHE